MPHPPAAAPLVSVVIPTRDRAELLLEALRSLQAQTSTAWEALVVDDGSTDSSRQRVGEVAALDPRVRWLDRRGEPAGANRCRNQGLEAARGDLVLFLDSDDLLSPDCLAGRVERLHAAPELDFAVFPHDHFCTVPGDVRSAPRTARDGEDHLERFLSVDIPWQTAGPLWRRSAIQRLGGWDERLERWQDWELHVRALARGARYRCYAAPVFHHRVAGHREVVSLPTPSAEHLASQWRAIVSAERELQGAGRLNRHRGRLLAWLRFTVVAAWVELHGLPSALRRRSELFGGPGIPAAADLLALASTPIPWARGGTRRVLRWWWGLP